MSNTKYLRDRAKKIQDEFAIAKDKALKVLIEATQELLQSQKDLSQELTEVTKLMENEAQTEEVLALPAAGETTPSVEEAKQDEQVETPAETTEVAS